jgi:hypothetical protein
MKTSNKLLLSLLILVIASITALAIAAKIYINKNTIAGNGNKTTETREVGAFNRINIKGHMKVILTQGTDTKLKINTDENLIPLVESVVEDGELIIQLKDKIHRGDIIEIYLTVDSKVNDMKFSSAITVETPEVLTGDNMHIETSSGSQALLKLNYRELFLDASSGGNVTLSGIADQAIFKFTSGGSISAEGFQVAHAVAEGSSGGHASINVTKELKVDVSSGANLDYAGNAVISSMSQSSGGSINKQ